MADPADRVLHVPAESDGLALTAVLRRWLPEMSWSQVRGLVKSRRVLIDGNPPRETDRRMRQGEVIKLLAHPAAAPATEQQVRIEYLDADLVVVEKPAGMTSIRHPEERFWSDRRRQQQPTLTELLPRIVARAEHGRRGAPRPLRAVHRLDRETSGLMVFARNVQAERMLGGQFREHSIHRAYLAVAQGQVEPQSIETYLVADRGDGRRGSAQAAGVGKRAVTHLLPVESVGECTLVECRLETGRTHQIRIHLAELGHPVCGDKVYGARPGTAKPRAVPQRLALHAAQLGFVHPNGRTVEFESPLPDDLRTFLEKLRAQVGPNPSTTTLPSASREKRRRRRPRDA